MNAKDHNPVIDTEDVRRSLRDDIARVPLVNKGGDRIFIADTELSKDRLTLVLENGQKVTLKVGTVEG